MPEQNTAADLAPSNNESLSSTISKFGFENLEYTKPPSPLSSPSATLIKDSPSSALLNL